MGHMSTPPVSYDLSDSAVDLGGKYKVKSGEEISGCLTRLSFRFHDIKRESVAVKTTTSTRDPETQEQNNVTGGGKKVSGQKGAQ